MRRAALLIVIFLASAIALLASVSVFLPQFFPQQMMTGMGGMMAQGAGVGMGNLLWPMILSISIALLIVTVAYVLLFPNIKYTTELAASSQKTAAAVDHEPMEIVMRVVKPDERAALEVLIGNGGLCLQKDLTYKTGLSKLKTHRIVARLAERGIIQVKKVGRTNEISVPVWLRGDRSPADSDASAYSPVETHASEKPTITNSS
jgi:predicted transcriptional regulator